MIANVAGYVFEFDLPKTGILKIREDIEGVNTGAASLPFIIGEHKKAAPIISLDMAWNGWQWVAGTKKINIENRKFSTWGYVQKNTWGFPGKVRFNFFIKFNRFLEETENTTV